MFAIVFLVNVGLLKLTWAESIPVVLNKSFMQTFPNVTDRKEFCIFLSHKSAQVWAFLMFFSLIRAQHNRGARLFIYVRLRV